MSLICCILSVESTVAFQAAEGRSATRPKRSLGRGEYLFVRENISRVSIDMLCFSMDRISQYDGLGVLPQVLVDVSRGAALSDVRYGSPQLSLRYGYTLSL